MYFCIYSLPRYRTRAWFYVGAFALSTSHIGLFIYLSQLGLQVHAWWCVHTCTTVAPVDDSLCGEACGPVVLTSEPAALLNSVWELTGAEMCPLQGRHNRADDSTVLGSPPAQASCRAYGLHEEEGTQTNVHHLVTPHTCGTSQPASAPTDSVCSGLGL